MRVENHAESDAQQLFVVGEDDSDRHLGASLRRSSVRGIHALTRQPLPVGPAKNRPLCRPTRSRIPISPWPNCGGAVTRAAVVVDHYAQILLAAADRHVQPGGARRVLERVRDSFLDQPEQRELQAVGEPLGRAADLVGHLQARTARGLEQRVQVGQVGLGTQLRADVRPARRSRTVLRISASADASGCGRLMDGLPGPFGVTVELSAAPSVSAIITERLCATMSCISRAMRLRSAITASSVSRSRCSSVVLSARARRPADSCAAHPRHVSSIDAETTRPDVSAHTARYPGRQRHRSRRHRDRSRARVDPCRRRCSCPPCPRVTAGTWSRAATANSAGPEPAGAGREAARTGPR